MNVMDYFFDDELSPFFKDKSKFLLCHLGIREFPNSHHDQRPHLEWLKGILRLVNKLKKCAQSILKLIEWCEMIFQFFTVMSIDKWQWDTEM